jgi:hypothetical protein
MSEIKISTVVPFDDSKRDDDKFKDEINEAINETYLIARAYRLAVVSGDKEPDLQPKFIRLEGLGMIPSINNGQSKMLKVVAVYEISDSLSSKTGDNLKI